MEDTFDLERLQRAVQFWLVKRGSCTPQHLKGSTAKYVHTHVYIIYVYNIYISIYIYIQNYVYCIFQYAYFWFNDQ